ncbi:MAG: helix-turn-helix domain-containing protein [Segniliparus sp.]|uniref:helix-turn-helix domain-containing protein n=1 Tax=Segniliparus sp. TaxID=2804064 RepID=UPI003F38FA6D
MSTSSRKAAETDRALEARLAAQAEKVDVASLAIELGRVRVAKKLTLDNLEARTGIPRNTISRYEHGKLNPTAKALLKLSIGLEENISELVKPLDHLPKTAATAEN